MGRVSDLAVGVNPYGAASAGPALDVQANWQARRVGICIFDVQTEAGGLPTEAHWADAQHVDGLEQFGLELRDLRILVPLVYRSQERFLGELHRDIGRPAYSHTQYRWRARNAAGPKDRVEGEFLDPLEALGRRRHRELAHVLRACALRHHSDLDVVLVVELPVA